MLAGDITERQAFVEDLRPEGETTPIVRYTVEAVVPGTNTPITTITAGRDFEMRVLVEDLRNDGNANRGVFAGWTDLQYDKALAKVRVYEIQTLTIPGAAPTTGQFTLTLGAGQTTAPINYSKANNTERAATAVDIQTKLNNLLGPNAVTVHWNGFSNIYQIRFSGLPDVDHPLLQSSPAANATIVENVAGDPTSPISFREAFRSRDLPGTLNTAGTFQTDVTATDAPNLVDELGAQRGLGPPTGNAPQELVRARMTAQLPVGQGTSVLSLVPFFGTNANPAQQFPVHRTLVYADLTLGENDTVDPEAIVGVAANLTISLALTAQNTAASVNEDDPAGVAIPVLPLVAKNPAAPAGAIELRRFSQPVAGGTVVRFDPANTPADFTDDQVRFIPALDFTGTATFTYTAGIVGDPLPADEATGTITITVDPVNDAPQNIVPPPQVTLEDQALVFSQAAGNLIRVIDSDADPAGLRVTLAASHGDITLSGIAGLTFTTGDGTADGTMTFSGTTTNVNAALAGLSYKPGLNSTLTATITMTSADIVPGGSGGLKQDQDTFSVSITPVNDAPVVTAPVVQNGFTASPIVFSTALQSAIRVNDVDAGGDAMSVTVTAAGGIGTLAAVAAPGATISGNGTTSLTIGGSQTAINAALNGLTLTPGGTPVSGSLTVLANDLGHNPGPELTGQSVIAVNVNVPLVRYTVQTVLPGTNTPVTSITAGRDFEVRVLVEDLRNDGNPNRGVFAAWTDLRYNEALAKVRVYEIQTLSIPGAAPTTGQFTLTLGPGQTTAPINYSKANDTERAATAVEIQSKLNALLGEGAVTVNWSGLGNQYEIRFSGLADVDHPLLTAAPGTAATLAETVKGDPTNPTSFREAFRSRDLPGTVNTGGSYQNALTAGDGADLIDELGGVRGTDQPPGNEPLELVRARMTAQLPAGVSSQVLTLLPFFGTTASPAQEFPAHQTLVYADLTLNEQKEVPPELISAIAGSLTVTTTLAAQNGTASVAEDSLTGVAIPVLNLVSKDASAPPGAPELRSFSQSAGGTVERIDLANTPTNLSDDLVRFIPAPNFTGTATFTYTVGIAGDPLPENEATGTITVTVNPENDAPENHVPGAQVTPEDVPLVFSEGAGNLIRVVDPDADPAGLSVTLTVSHGHLTLSTTAGLTFGLGDGTADTTMTFSGTTTAVNAALAGLSYRPALHNTATATITITSNDLVAAGSGGLKQDQDTISVAITATNDAPVVTAPATQNVFTQNAVVFSAALGNAIAVNDPDAGIDAISVTLTATGGVGTLTAVTAAGAAITGNGTASVVITGSQAAVNAALNGLTLTPPAAPATGSITIVANDQGHNPGPAQQGQAAITVNVTTPIGPFAANDAPAGLLEGSATYSIDVLANDLATAGNSAIIIDFTQPSIGTISKVDNGTPTDPTDDRLIYTPPLKNGLPDLDFFTPAGAPVTFTYRVNQSPTALTTSAPGTVTIRIANVADNPVANNDGQGNSYSTTIGTALTRNAAQGVLANDTTVDNQYGDTNVAALTVLGAAPGAPLTVNSAQNGTVTINVDGSFSYTPPGGFTGNDTFTYRAHSSLGGDSNTATVTIHVSAPPTAGNDSFTAQEDAPFTSPTSVLANDSDPSDGEQLFAVLVSNVPAQAGSVTLAANGTFTYNPAPHFNTTRPLTGPITFTYRASNEAGTRQSALATVSITVNDVNDNPTATSDVFDAVQRVGPLGADQLFAVLANDSIAPDAAETLQVTGLIGAGNIAVTADASGNTQPVTTTGGGSVRLQNFQVLYTSPVSVGVDSFSYVVSDGRGGTASASVLVSVLPPLDYGDAADTFGTLLASNGARHLSLGPHLGATRDQEANGAPSAGADGDDLQGTDDEDGVSASLLLRGKASSVTVTASAAALLDGWIDYNHNGTFDAGEQFATSAAVVAGSNVINFTVPAGATVGLATARLRISTAGGLAPTGLAQDGEVEDHIFTILQDLEVNLPSGGSTNKVSLRVAGANVEVFDTVANQSIASSPQAFTRNVVVSGSPTVADEITIDYAAGGFPAVLGTISVDGGAGPGDLLVVKGAAEGTSAAQYMPQGQSLGNATLRTMQGGTPHDVAAANFEPLTITGMASFETLGNLNIGGDTLTLSVTSPVTLAALTTVAGGTLNSTSNIALAAGRTLQASGTINATITAAAGSTIVATGPLTLGRDTAPFAIGGTLNVGGNNVTLLSSAAADLGTVTTLAGGTLTSDKGLTLAAGEAIQGFGQVNTPNASAQALVNSGAIEGTSDAQRITLAGFVTGLGTLNNVIVTGTLSPGASPAAVTYGSVNFTPTSKLVLEVGGTTAGGQYDQLNLTGSAALAGTIEVSFINGFSPAIGDEFNVLNATGGVTGDFTTFVKPTLAARQRWWDDLTPGANQVQLLVSPQFPRQNPKAGNTVPATGIRRHDVNDDNGVFASDALAVINHINAFGSGAIPLTPRFVTPYLDVNGDNNITAADALDIINLINAGLNVIPPGGEGGEGEGGGLSLAAALSPPALADTIALLAQDWVENGARRRKN